jgi:hypothetical protein
MERIKLALNNGGPEGRRIAGSDVRWQWMIAHQAPLGLTALVTDDLTRSVMCILFSNILELLGSSENAAPLLAAFFRSTSSDSGSVASDSRWWQGFMHMTIQCRVIALRTSRTFAEPLEILRSRFPHGIVMVMPQSRSDLPPTPELMELWRKYWAVGDELSHQYRSQSWDARSNLASDVRGFRDMQSLLLWLWPMFYELRSQEVRASCEYELFDAPLRLVCNAWS